MQNNISGKSIKRHGTIERHATTTIPLFFKQGCFADQTMLFCRPKWHVLPTIRGHFESHLQPFEYQHVTRLRFKDILAGLK